MEAYEILYNQALVGDFIVEPMYSAISIMANYFGFGFKGVIWFYAISTIAIKIYFLRNYAKLKWHQILIYLLLYSISFMLLYEVSQLRSSLMLALLAFIFVSPIIWHKISVWILSILTHASAVIALPLIFSRSKIYFILFIPLFLLIISLNYFDLYNFILERTLNKFNDTVSNPFLYLLHPFFISVVIFIFALSRVSKVYFQNFNCYGIIYVMILICTLYIFLLIGGSRTSSFRIMEIGLYFTNLLSFIFYFKMPRNHSIAFGFTFIFSYISFFTYTFVLAVDPVVNWKEINLL
jgi:hypothetical protein